MNTISDIQAQPGWSIVTVPSIDGPSKAPGIPDITFTQQAPPPPPKQLSMSITGVPGKYADGVVRSPDLPLPIGTKNAVLRAAFSVDATSLVNAGGLEMGAKFTMPDGTTLNGQIQFGYNESATTMLLSLTSITGTGWSPTTLVLPKFAPDVEHTVAIGYELGSLLDVVFVHVDGIEYVTPPEMLGVPGKSLGWGENSFMTNFQANSKPTGGSWSWTLISVSMQLLVE
jgi:hypothetical protein